MRKVLVTFPEIGASAAITLTRGVTSVSPCDVAFAWCRSTVITVLSDDHIEVSGSEALIGDLGRFLTDLQNGLLYADLARLTPCEDSRPAISPVPARDGRVDLSGADGRSAILAFWGDTVPAKRVADLARGQGRVAFTLSSERGVARTRFSLLVPAREAERALEDLTALRALRARPGRVVPAPRPISLDPEAGREQSSDGAGPQSDYELIRAGAGSLLAAAVDLHNWADGVRPSGERDPYRAEVLDLLLRGWRLGHNPSAPRPVPDPVSAFLRERARVIAEVTRAPRESGDVRAAADLTMKSSLEAVLVGAGENPELRTRFREECLPPLRGLTPEDRAHLIALHQEETDSGFPKHALARLRRAGLLLSSSSLLLTDAGRNAARAELEHRSRGVSILTLAGQKGAGSAEELPPAREEPQLRQEDAADPSSSTPSARSVSVPEAAEPPKGAPSTQEVPVPEEVAERIRADAREALRVFSMNGRRKTPPRRKMSALLLDWWQKGRQTRRPDTGRKRAPSTPRLVALFAAERVRVISSLLLERYESPDLEAAEALLVASGAEFWGLGVLAARRPTRALPPRFREECAEEMRPVPEAARDALVRVSNGAPPRSLPQKTLTVLERSGHLSRRGRGWALTETGRAAALAERRRAEEGLPSVLDLLSGH